MIKQANHTQNCWLLVPFYGTLLYVFLYVIATLVYPGGSQFDTTAKGFSWMQNYWCNLLNETAINGQPNPARTVALFAMLVLCLTLLIFWFLFPKQIPFTKTGTWLMQTSAFLSMATGMFLFTSFHDIIINVATLFGMVAVVGTFIGLYKLKWRKLFWMGMFTLPIIAVNNVLYYNKGLLFYLPVVQKITFLYFLLWICLISIQLYKKQLANA